MKESFIIQVHKDVSIPWFEQIKKTVQLPYRLEKEIYHTIKPPDYVTALTLTKENKFIILKQYRPAVEDYTYELPSGHMEHGETPVQAIMRELREETACEAGEVRLLGELIPDTGRLENRLWAFYISNIELKYIPAPEKNDGIEVFIVSYAELLQMINTGRLNHALDLSVIALAIFKKCLTL